MWPENCGSGHSRVSELRDDAMGRKCLKLGFGKRYCY